MAGTDQQKQATHSAAETDEYLRAKLAELEAIYATAPIGLVVFDTEFRYVRVNERLAEMNGIPADQHIGKTIREMAPEIADRIESCCREVIQTGQPLLKAEITVKTSAQAGLQTRLANYFPLKAADGRCIGINAVIEDVTERKQLEEQLRAADRNKNEFLAMLSHELRNPLGIISNAIQMLPITPKESSEIPELRTILNRQIKHMTRLIDDLLDLARISRGQLRLVKDPCDFSEIVRDTLRDSRGLLESSGLQLKTHLPRRNLWVLGDRTRLAQCISNLLHNSSKFTDAGGTITVILERLPEQDWAVLTVRDTGIGMGPEILADVLKTFHHSDRTADRSRGGLGLGLALVKGFIELHGGTVEALSEGPDRGSEFIIRLPLCAQPVQTIEPKLFSAEESRYRILIIDDNVIAARAQGTFLTDQGHAVEIAHNGLKGLDVTRQFHPDVVLCDIGLPGFNGYQVAQQLRKQLQNVYLIAVSGYAEDEIAERVRQAGFDRYMAKPIDLNELERSLQRFAEERNGEKV